MNLWKQSIDKRIKSEDEVKYCKRFAEDAMHNNQAATHKTARNIRRYNKDLSDVCLLHVKSLKHRDHALCELSFRF